MWLHKRKALRDFGEACDRPMTDPFAEKLLEG
jgi:hypothetical protein